jgi:hypothetical protein
MFSVYRDYINVEHDLQNHHSTWHLAMQALLFTTLGVIGTWQIGKGMPDNLRTERDFLPYNLMLARCLIAIATYISIDAALDSPDPKWLCFAARFFDLLVNDLVAGYRISGDGLLREAKEQLSPAARPAPVEPERDLIQIVVQVFVVDRTPMRSQ